MKLAEENPDLRDVYLKKLTTSEKDVSAAHNLTRREPVQKCLNDLAKVVESRKPKQWVSGPVFVSHGLEYICFIQRTLPLMARNAD